MQQYDKTMLKIINFDVAKEQIKENDSNWLQIPDDPYRILIVGGFGPDKTNLSINLINHQPDVDKFIYMLQIPMKQNINC